MGLFSSLPHPSGRLEWTFLLLFPPLREARMDSSLSSSPTVKRVTGRESLFLPNSETGEGRPLLAQPTVKRVTVRACYSTDQQ